MANLPWTIFTMNVHIAFGLDRCKGFIGLHKLRSFVNALGVPLGHRHNDREKW